MSFSSADSTYAIYNYAHLVSCFLSAYTGPVSPQSLSGSAGPSVYLNDMQWKKNRATVSSFCIHLPWTSHLNLYCTSYVLLYTCWSNLASLLCSFQCKQSKKMLWKVTHYAGHFWLIPALISCTGATGRWGLLSHAQKCSKMAGLGNSLSLC